MRNKVIEDMVRSQKNLHKDHSISVTFTFTEGSMYYFDIVYWVGEVRYEMKDFIVSGLIFTTTDYSNK
jgi:hypothetical protein